MQQFAETLRKTLAENVRARIAILAVIAAIIGWQFLPAWLRLAIVKIGAYPVS
jgi:hypothetical protein